MGRIAPGERLPPKMQDLQTFRDALHIGTSVLGVGMVGVLGWLVHRGGPRSRAIRSARGMGLRIEIEPSQVAGGLVGQVTFHRYLEYDVGLELAERGMELVLLSAQPAHPTTWRAGIVLPVGPHGRFEIGADQPDPLAGEAILVVVAPSGTVETGRGYSGIRGFIATSDVVRIPT